MSQYGTAATITLLEEVIEVAGEDKVVDVCKYRTADFEPVCIVGQVLDRVGLLDRIQDNESANWLNDNTRQFDRIAHLFPEFSSKAVVVLQAAQNVQDQKRSWGAALSVAKETAEMVSS